MVLFQGQTLKVVGFIKSNMCSSLFSLGSGFAPDKQLSAQQGNLSLRSPGFLEGLLVMTTGINLSDECAAILSPLLFLSLKWNLEQKHHHHHLSLLQLIPGGGDARKPTHHFLPLRPLGAALLAISPACSSVFPQFSEQPWALPMTFFCVSCLESVFFA